MRNEYIIPESAGSITNTDREFNIYFEENLSLVGQTITVSVVAISESRYDTTTTKQVTSNFDVTYKNPCIDQAFVVIENGAFQNLDYTIGEGAKTYPAHGEFTVSTTPLVGHTLCGDLKYTVYYNELPIDGSGPLFYTGPSWPIVI